MWSMKRRVAVRVGGQRRMTLARDSRVADIEPDVIYRVANTPNDPCYTNCFGISQWALDHLGAPSAWDTVPGTSVAVRVAVLDTGVRSTHPDFGGRVNARERLLEPEQHRQRRERSRNARCRCHRGDRQQCHRCRRRELGCGDPLFQGARRRWNRFRIRCCGRSPCRRRRRGPRHQHVVHRRPQLDPAERGGLRAIERRVDRRRRRQQRVDHTHVPGRLQRRDGGRRDDAERHARVVLQPWHVDHARRTGRRHRIDDHRQQLSGGRRHLVLGTTRLGCCRPAVALHLRFQRQLHSFAARCHGRLDWCRRGRGTAAARRRARRGTARRSLCADAARLRARRIRRRARRRAARRW